MADFDLLEDAEEILQPLCLCLNQDFSRIGVGHHKGYVVYRVHRTSSSHGSGATSAAAAVGGEEEFTSSKPPFFTTVEVVYPPRGSSTNSSPTWDVQTSSPKRKSQHFDAASVAAVTLSSQINESRSRLSNLDENELGVKFPPVARSSPPPSQYGDKSGEGVDNDMFHVQGENPAVVTATNVNTVGAAEDGISISAVETVFDENQPTTKTLVESHSSQWMSMEGLAPRPLETGVGVMALLYKTQFVAAVGGGPYPTGPRNVVKLFVSGGMWADRSVPVPDAVEDIRLDHRLIIIFTTKELRLHSFETGQCTFAIPVQADGSLLWSMSNSLPSVFGASTSFSSVFQQSSNTQASGGIGGSTDFGSPGENSVRYAAPLAIDYNKKCLVFRSSARGFSLIRYDAASSPCSRMGAELLATQPVAHEHRLASLAMDLGGESNSCSGTIPGCKRWHVATCSEHATLIRIWRYVERRYSSQHAQDTSTNSTSGAGASAAIPVATGGGGKSVDDSAVFPGADHLSRNSGNTEDELPGYFEKVKEVRNAVLPRPIFQMQFLSENFLFCIAWNTLKVFYVGERKSPKPYDISVKDMNKVMCTQNNQSSLHHLGLVSSYFKSEWAACECPLPLADGVFLPKWVHTTSVELRKHLLHGMGTCGKDNVIGAQSTQSNDVGYPFCSTNDMQDTHLGTQCKQSQRLSKTASVSNSQNWGDSFRRYVALQMAPIVGGASRASMSYWMTSGNNNNASENMGRGTLQGACRGNEAGVNVPQERDYATMEDIAQALVVWWEKPIYWQLDSMMNSIMRVDTGGALQPFPASTPGITVLHCVTCDGSAVSFEFDRIAGTIRCSKAATVLECDVQT